ncbi:MAG: MATE family efflux transporter [Muribaculaceae bacterium]|nr:MATE family efflux transporter [Muribaculaceae bacterium]
MTRRCLEILKLALPVMVSQVGLIVVAFADNIMVGRYSTQALASASFVINLFNLVVFCGLGFSYGLTPLVGALFARGEHRNIGRMMRAGLRANMLVGLLLSLVMLVLYFFIDRMGQPAELLPLIRPYFIIFLVSVLPMMVFNAFAQWSYAVKNTSMPMWILLACNGLNIGGNYMLIYGNWGAPELGLTGAGLSTLAARVLAAATITLIFFFRKKNRAYRDGFAAARRDGAGLMRKVVATSWPVSLQMTFETGSFSFCAVFAGWLGTASLAAFQVVTVVSTLGFCIYYSVGTAIAVLVANSMGAAARSARRVAWDGYVVMLMFALLSSGVFAVFAGDLMSLFTDDGGVLALATSVIVPLVLYQLGDATQITFANALRGTANVMPMLWIAFVSYLCVGLPSTYLLAFVCGLGVYGIILSFSVSLFLAAGLFMWSFMRTTRRTPAPAGSVMKESYTI